MTNDELRSLAEIAGYKAPFLEPRAGKIHLWTTGENAASWRPDEDLNQAFEVVAGLRIKGWDYELYSWDDMPPAGGVDEETWCEAEHYCAFDHIGKEGMLLRPFCCCADTPQLAVCRGALKIKAAETKGEAEDSR